MQGLILAVLAYTIWGLFPLFFSFLSHVSPIEVTAHRIIWSLVATLTVGLALRRGKHLWEALHNKTTLLWLGGSAVFIAINCLVSIWALVAHRVL